MVAIVNIPSNGFNALNFILFDLLFATSIHYLTSAIAGLSNCSSVLNYSDEDLGLRKNLLVGPGITCTKRRVFYSLATLRLVSWLLIFATTFFITGTSVFDIEQSLSNVTTIGKFGKNQVTAVLLERGMLRRGCQGSRDNFTYFGEIRDTRNCELDIDLLVNPVKFGFAYEATDISLQQCKTEEWNRTDFLCKQKGVIATMCRTSTLAPDSETCTTYGISPVANCTKTSSTGKNATFDCLINKQKEILRCEDIYTWERIIYRCKNAIIGCYWDKLHVGRKKICYATVNMQHGMYLCDGLIPEKVKQTSDCKKAEGIKWNSEEWLDYVGGRSVSTLDDAFAILYASGSESRPVKVRKDQGRLVTHIKPLWFVILCTKICAVATLAIIALTLRARRGLKPLANDEHGIMKLLQAAMAQRIRPSHVEGEQEGEEQQEEEEQQVFVRLESGAPQLRHSREG